MNLFLADLVLYDRRQGSCDVLCTHISFLQIMCYITEEKVAGIHILADVFAKNCFGLLFWSTLWRCLDGSWTVASLHARLSRERQAAEKNRAEADDRIWRATSVVDADAVWSGDGDDEKQRDLVAVCAYDVKDPDR